MIRLITLLIFVLVIGPDLHAQFVKDLGRDLKRDAEWKLNRKMRQKIDQGVDSLTKKRTKGSKKKTSEDSNAERSQPETNDGTGKRSSGSSSAVSMNTPGERNAAPTSSEGYITLVLSSPVTTKGLSIDISGESIYFEKWKSVNLAIKGPNGTENTTIPLNTSGTYSIRFADISEEGNYQLTATSSDGKATTTAELLVLDWSEPDEETKEIIKTVKEASDLLRERAEEVKSAISSKDKAELDKKLKESENRIEALSKLLQSLVEARRQVSDLYKQKKIPSKNIRDQLSLLNSTISKQSTEMKSVLNVAKHKANAITICEKIVLLNEACAAFSTFSNVAASSLSAILKNILLDKGVPKAVEVVNKGRINSDFEWGGKEASKIYATSVADAEGLVSKMGIAGFTGDVVQYATDVLLKVYCGVFKGKLTHKYKLTFRNEEGRIWWTYTVTAEAVITLRYPNTYKSGIIRMKGNIEGNAIKFTFQADPDENPEYKNASSKNLRTMVVKNFTPFTLPSSMALQDELGFGMLARAVATPAYFNLVVDADYNTDDQKIKLSITNALMDYLPTIFNRQFFVQWPAGLPVLRLMDYPIHSAQLTINASLKNQNEFDVKKDRSGSQSFGDQLERRIGTPKDPTEHIIELSLSVKKEN